MKSIRFIYLAVRTILGLALGIVAACSALFLIVLLIGDLMGGLSSDLQVVILITTIIGGGFLADKFAK